MKCGLCGRRVSADDFHQRLSSSMKIGEQGGGRSAYVFGAGEMGDCAPDRIRIDLLQYVGLEQIQGLAAFVAGLGGDRSSSGLM